MAVSPSRVPPTRRFALEVLARWHPKPAQFDRKTDMALGTVAYVPGDQLIASGHARGEGSSITPSYCYLTPSGIELLAELGINVIT